MRPASAAATRVPASAADRPAERPTGKGALESFTARIAAAQHSLATGAATSAARADKVTLRAGVIRLHNGTSALVAETPSKQQQQPHQHHAFISPSFPVNSDPAERLHLPSQQQQLALIASQADTSSPPPNSAVGHDETPRSRANPIKSAAFRNDSVGGDNVFGGRAQPAPSPATLTLRAAVSETAATSAGLHPPRPGSATATGGAATATTAFEQRDGELQARHRLQQLIASAEFTQSSTTEFYAFGKVLGAGSFGEVRLGWHRLAGSKVAIKCYEKSRLTDPANWRRVQQEI